MSWSLRCNASERTTDLLKIVFIMCNIMRKSKLHVTFDNLDASVYESVTVAFYIIITRTLTTEIY